MDEDDILGKDISHDGSDDLDEEDETSSIEDDEPSKLLPNFIEL